MLFCLNWFQNPFALGNCTALRLPRQILSISSCEQSFPLTSIGQWIAVQTSLKGLYYGAEKLLLLKHIHDVRSFTSLCRLGIPDSLGSSSWLSLARVNWPFVRTSTLSTSLALHEALRLCWISICFDQTSFDLERLPICICHQLSFLTGIVLYRK